MVINEKKLTKIQKLLFVVAFQFLFITDIYCQLGFSVSYSLDKALSCGLIISSKEDDFYFGFSNQFNGQKNTVVKKRKVNYGLTQINKGDFYWLIDLGYGRSFAKIL